MHELKNAIIEPYKINLDRLDSTIWGSKYRVKYTMSHDEIGNLDGTRLIPKVITSYLDLFNRVPEDQQKLVLQMIRAALGSQEQ